MRMDGPALRTYGRVVEIIPQSLFRLSWRDGNRPEATRSFQAGVPYIKQAEVRMVGAAGP